MAGKGTYYQRSDGLWAFRIRASNGQIVATDGGQGYTSSGPAKSTLTNVMAGVYKGGGVTTRADGRFGFRVIAVNGEIVAVDGSQGYENRGDAQDTFDKLTRGDYNGPTEEG